LTQISLILFSVTLIAAGLHAVGVGHDEWIGSVTGGEILSFLAIATPAFGTAFGGIRAEREYLENAERYGLMAQQLSALRQRTRFARTLRSLQQAAMDVERVMLQENRDWFVVMSQHPIGVPF
jgi:hypothetical protein